MLQLFGQEKRFIPRFVHYRGHCPYKFEKNWRKILESAQNHRNFASTKINN